MKRVGIFMDVSNLYFCIDYRFPNRRLNYSAYMDYCKSFGKITVARAYGAQQDGEAETFKTKLKTLGFEPIYKTPKEYGEGDKLKRKADWDVGIAVDVIKEFNNLDLIILGTGDGDLTPLITYAQEHGKTVLVLACSISRDLRDLTKAVEIPQSMLVRKPKKRSTHA